MKTELCPDCGSGKLDFESELLMLETDVRCLECGWRGKGRDVMITKVDTPRRFAAPDMAQAVAEDVALTYQRKLAAVAAVHIGLAMVDAGIVGRQDKDNLTRLVRAATLGAHRATLEEIETIQKELQGERPGN